MGYKLLGFVVWKGAKLVVRRKYGHLAPPRPVLIGGLVVIGVGAAAAYARASNPQ